jgi:hypothetical protein
MGGDEGRGTYGRAGAYTENFAIGSIFYSLTWGLCPRKIQAEEFPKYNSSCRVSLVAGPRVFPQHHRIIFETVMGTGEYDIRTPLKTVELIP